MGRRLRLLRRSERGFSLTEIVLAGALTAASLTIASGFLISAQRTVSIEQTRSNSNDESRAAMEQVDREVRSSNFILTLDPYTLIVETQNNAPTPVNNCVVWVLEDRQLRRRSWPVNGVDDPTKWRVVAEHVVNQELNQPLFELPNTLNNRLPTGGRTVDVTIHVNPDLEDSPSSTVVSRQSLTGRNIPADDFVLAGQPWPPTAPPVRCSGQPSP